MDFLKLFVNWQNCVALLIWFGLCVYLSPLATEAVVATFVVCFAVMNLIAFLIRALRGPRRASDS
jgi:hypothetical protein